MGGVWVLREYVNFCSPNVGVWWLLRRVIINQHHSQQWLGWTKIQYQKATTEGFGPVFAGFVLTVLCSLLLWSLSFDIYRFYRFIQVHLPNMHPPTCMAHKKTACLLLDFRGTDLVLAEKYLSVNWWANTQSFHLLISFSYLFVGCHKKANSCWVP